MRTEPPSPRRSVLADSASRPGGHEEPDADLPHHLRRGLIPCEAKELLHSNLHEVFSERDPERRWAAIERTYTKDVRFIEPGGEFAGWQALSDQAQKLLDGPLAGFVHGEDGPQYIGTDTAALAWRVGPPGKPVARGIDLVTIRDGRLSVVRTLMALGLLGLPWADGDGMAGLPPKPPTNLDQTAASIPEPEAPAGG